MSDRWLDRGHGDGRSLAPVRSAAVREDATEGRPPGSWRSLSGRAVVAALAVVALIGSAGTAYAIRGTLFPSLGAPTSRSVWQNPVPVAEPPPAAVTSSTSSTTIASTTTTSPVTTSSQVSNSTSSSGPQSTGPADAGGSQLGSDDSDNSGHGSRSDSGPDDSGGSGADDSGGDDSSGSGSGRSGSPGSDRSGSGGSGSDDRPDDRFDEVED